MDFWDEVPAEIVSDAEHGQKTAVAFLQTAPDIEDRFQYYWMCFQGLSTERQLGMSHGPIPDSAIYALAEQDELDVLETEAFHYIMRMVDIHKSKLAAAKMVKEQERSTAKR